MKQTLKDFLKYGLNRLDDFDEDGYYCRYIGNYLSDFDNATFTTKKEATERYQQEKKDNLYLKKIKTKDI